MEAEQKSYRLYNCKRCAKQVRICRKCDRGNRYCADGCAQIRRRESRCRASARYQKSYRGALKHATRQGTWRRRWQQRVTHQGSPAVGASLIVVSSSILKPTPRPHAQTTDIKPPPAHGLFGHARQTTPRCSFCGGMLAPLARLEPLRGGP
jgi:hypothetical protein